MDSSSNAWKQCETTQLFGQPAHFPGDTMDFYIVATSAVAQKRQTNSITFHKMYMSLRQ